MKLDKLIDLAGLGLTAFIIFTLVKSFKGLADWLGGAGETIKKAGETISEIGSGAVQEITKPTPIPLPIVKSDTGMRTQTKAEEFGATVTRFITRPLPMAIAETTTEQVLKKIIKPKPIRKTTSKPVTSAHVHPLVKARVIKTGTRYLARKHASPREFKKFFEMIRKV